jgi:hypothetical protein
LLASASRLTLEFQSSRRAICKALEIMDGNAKAWLMLRLLLIARNGPCGRAQLSCTPY